MEKRRVVITGVGLVTPLGTSKEEFWDSLHQGRTGVKKITSFDPTGFPTQLAGEVQDFDPSAFIDLKKARRMDRFVQFAVASAKMAVADADIDIQRENREKIGVFAGTATAGQGWVFRQYEVFQEKGFEGLNPFTAASTFPNAASTHVSLEFRLTGISDTVSSGCASSSAAIGLAFDAIRTGKMDAMFVVGSEAPLYAPIFGAYCAARLMSRLNGSIPQAPRPFDKNRDGIVLGEGGGAVILEELEHALNRGAHIYGEIIGWASTCDAYNMIGYDPEGTQFIRAIQLAIESASISPSDISYIKAHGSGEPITDKIETKVIKAVFGKRAYEVPMSSVKSMIGHTQGASGVIELIATLLAMEASRVPPTINYETFDPECDLDYVPNVSRDRDIDVVLSNVMGFGGKNVSILVKKFRS